MNEKLYKCPNVRPGHIVVVLGGLFRKSLCLFVIALSSNVNAYQGTAIETYFTECWVQNSWQAGSRSGPGSGLMQTKTIREAIPGLLRRYKCEVMVDAPCGDFYWMQTVDLPLKKYIGVDVVKPMIEVNKERYGSDLYSFMHLNIIEQTLPKADIVFCRDCFGHFSYGDIAKSIRRLKLSGSTYLLTTSFTEWETNFDIPTKPCEWRPINLMHEPFCFPEPLETISENYTGGNGICSDKSLLLWKIDDLPDLPITE